MDQKKDDGKNPSSIPTEPKRETVAPTQEPAENQNASPSEDNNQTNTSAAEKWENSQEAKTNATASGASTIPMGDGNDSSSSSENSHQHPLDTSRPFLATGPPTTETACGPGDSSIRVDMLGSDSDDITGVMNRLSRVSRVLMPIQQIADASTQMYPSLFHPIGASGVIIYSDGSTTDVSGLTIPYFDPLREIAAGLMSVSDPGGEQFEWNSLLESDTNVSRPASHIGDDYYIATYVDPDENSNILFTSMNPVSEIPYTTLEVMDGMDIDSARGIVISARPPGNFRAPPQGSNIDSENSSEYDSILSHNEPVSTTNVDENMATTVKPNSDQPTENKTVVATPDTTSGPSETPTSSPPQHAATPTYDPTSTPGIQQSLTPETVPADVPTAVTPGQEPAQNEVPSQEMDASKKEE